MKKIFYLLLLTTFLGCVEEMTLHEESPPSETSKPYTGLALFFQQKLNQLPRSRTSQTGLLEGRGTPLYEHVQVGNNKFYGGYYFIVPLQNSRGQIDAGLVYPVMGNDTINGYDFSDELGEPSILDAATLNGITHRGQRFLLSNKFLNWKKEGLSVSRGLYAYADSLDGKHYFTPFTSNASRQGSRSTRTVEEYPYDASVIIFYDILPSIDLDGGVVVSTPSVEASRLVFEGAFGSIGSIDGLGECSLTSVSGGEVYLQMTVTNQDVVENVVQVFMDAAISRFQLEHDVSRISYLYDYFLTERVEPPSGGEDVGSGVGGGNSNGGSENEEDEEETGGPEAIVDNIYHAQSGLTSEEKALLNDALVAFVNEYPEFQQIYNRILSLGLKFKFSVNPQVVGTSGAIYNSGTNEIVFASRNSITKDALQEELIHAIQCNDFYSSSLSQYHKDIEFEAKVFQDLLLIKYEREGVYLGSFGIEGEFPVAYNGWIIDEFLREGYNVIRERFHSFCVEWPNYPGTSNPTFVPRLIEMYIGEQNN